MAKIKVKCKSLSFRERSLDFKRIRPGNIISVEKDRAKILFDGGWVDYVNKNDIPKKEKSAEPERETKELKEGKEENK
jgi:hypothetical protein